MKPTLENIAKISNTSIATVSRALNGSGYVSQELKDKIDNAVKQIGYKKKIYNSASQFILNRISVVTNDDFSNPNSFYYAILSGLKFECERLNIELNITLLSSLPHEKALLRKEFEDTDAVIIVGMENPSLLDELKDIGVTVQIINGSDPNMFFSSISPDYEHGGFIAAQFLINNGNHKNCIITANIRQSLQDRQLGFQRAHRQYSSSMYCQCRVIDLVEYAKKHDIELYQRIRSGEAGGDFGAKQLMPKIISEGLLNDTDGIFCVCDLMAISVQQSLKHANITDKSLVGFDDLPISSLVSPQLTTIRSNYFDLAKQGLAMLINKHAHGTISGIRAYMAVELIERESVFDRQV